jgi:predicted PurR-regulated permease PerM
MVFMWLVVCFFEEKVGLQTSVASLILVVSAVVISCLVVDYAVNVVEATLQTSNIPQLARIKDMQRSLLNETDSLFNSTWPVP